jgi:peptidoglycan/xylan/chitin deacetylase (PgdA/CDA1 family)
VAVTGDRRRPVPSPAAARETAAAVEHEGHERTGVAVYVAWHDRAGGPAADVPDPLRRDGAEVAEAVARWHALLGSDVQTASTAAAARRVRTDPPRPGPTWTPPALGLPQDGPPLAGVTAAWAAGRLLRVVNYHSTPARLAERLEAELADYAARYTPISATDLAAIVDGRRPAPDPDRPALVLAFFDGFANNVEVAAPLLDRLGLPAWFHPLTAFLDTPRDHQPGVAREHRIRVAPEEVERGERLAMTWDDVAGLARRHDVGAHTATHAAAASVTTAAELEREVRTPLRRIAEVTGRPPASVAWLGGTPFDPEHPGDRAAREAGVPFLVSGLGYERLTR